MATTNRVLAVILLAVGVALVFLGLTASMGFTLLGVLSSAAAIAALLYTGGVWFGAAAPPPSPSADRSPVLFDRDGRIVGGPGAGQLLVSRFPAAGRAEIERLSATVFAGLTARFPCAPGSNPTILDGVPVRRADGSVIYGLLIPAETDSTIAPAL